MLSKYIKLVLLTVLIFSFSTIYTIGADAATKVMWGKTELKVGQIGKVTILVDTPLVKINGDGSLSTVRMLKKDDEFRVYQYKGQHNGLYGLGASSFVQKSDAMVKYETPSKSKLEQVKNGGKETEVNVSKAEKIFKEVLGDKYEIKVLADSVASYRNDNIIFSYVKDENKSAFVIRDSNDMIKGYEIMKELGLPISEKDFVSMYKKSVDLGESVQKGDVDIFSTGKRISIIW